MNKATNQPANEGFIQQGSFRETAIRFLDSFQILIIGLLIPFLFIFGITHNNKNTLTKAPQEIQNTKATFTTYSNGWIDYGRALSDENS